MEKSLKYYGQGDLSVGFYLERLKQIVDSLDAHTDNSIYDINDVMEFYNGVKFLDDGVHDTRWEPSYIKHTKSQKNLLKDIVGQFFSGLSVRDILTSIDNLKNEYNDDFITCFGVYDLGSRMTESDFKAILKASNIPDRYVMRSEYLAKKYPQTIKDIFLSDIKNFESFLGNFSISRSKEVFIPASVSKNDMLTFCNKYIESDEANANYVQILSNPIKGIERYLVVDAPTRLKAKHRTKQLEDKLFKSRSAGGLKISMAVLSSKKAYDEELSKSSPTDSIALVDGDWIKEHLDFPTLLNNVQYLYDFFTPDLISALPSYPKVEMGVMEIHLGVTTTNSYITGQYFSVKQWMAGMKVRALQELLSQHDIRLEEIIDWFFTSYCKETFGIEWLPINIPLKSEELANQTATLFRIEESIRKQYKAFAENNGKIDPELVNMMNSPSLKELPSLIKKKYIYLADNNDDIKSITNLLFSDQTSMTYISEKLKGHNFVELIVRNSVKKSNFHTYQMPALEFLLEENVIEEKRGKVLHFADPYAIKILRQLYERGVLGYSHMSNTEQAKIDEMLSDGRLQVKNTLLAEPEIDYLNFMLNSSTFDNSWSIRNNYQHGNPVYEEKQHYEFDNRIALLILLTHIIKINDELCLKEVAEGREGIYCEFF